MNFLSWEMFYHEDYPETKINGTKFYKTIFSFRNKSLFNFNAFFKTLKALKLYYIKIIGNIYESIISLKDDLLNHELTEHLSSNKKFSYILQTCFEMVESSIIS